MSHYYFGMGYWFWALCLISLFALGSYFVYSYTNTKAKIERTAFIILFGAALMSGAIMIDLTKSIDESRSTELERALTASYNNPQGEPFRKAMGDLAKERGVLVNSQSSYLGKDIYLTYITKADWNKLAKVYQNLNLPNIQ
ncbi:hypothetical protein ABH307_00660 [Acinetobacter pittii]|uniref:hypothetical protein n=1 Tax=Acinetobacter pittii TaxID=48296 RepID=UPI00325FE6BA